MNLAQILDLSIKERETNGTKVDKFYEIRGRHYYNYIDNESWKAFVDKMRESYEAIYRNYIEGAGDELGVKRTGKYPPKMASYGSSSRMIYLLARDISGFQFEKKLYTTVGGTANMDGYLKLSGKEVFVEAKCREPYNASTSIIDRKYESLYRYLDQNPQIEFNCDITIIDEKYMRVVFYAGKTRIARFDVKQMICHLLGIATEKIVAPSNESISFTYLLYNPTKIEIIDDAHKEKLLAVYRQEIKECDSVPFKDLFSEIVKYLLRFTNIKKADGVSAEALVSKFSFKRCDQTDFVESCK